MHEMMTVSNSVSQAISMLISQMCETIESNEIREQKGKSKTIAKMKVGIRNEKMTRP